MKKIQIRISDFAESQRSDNKNYEDEDISMPRIYWKQKNFNWANIAHDLLTPSRVLTNSTNSTGFYSNSPIKNNKKS